MELTSRTGRLFHLDGVLMAILIGSLGINVYLGTRARPAAPSRPDLLPAGSKAPMLEGTNGMGSKVAVNISDARPTVLYVFSPTCHWCERNVDNIKTIVKTRRDLRVIGINLGPKLDIATSKQQPFDEIIDPAGATVRAYHFSATPSTVLFRDGVITNAWSGAYAGPVADEISRVLAVSPPRLRGD